MKKNGFTLIEVMISITIIMILAGITQTTMRPLYQKWKIKQAAQNIQNELQAIKLRAFIKNTQTRYDFHGTNLVYTINNQNYQVKLEDGYVYKKNRNICSFNKNNRRFASNCNIKISNNTYLIQIKIGQYGRITVLDVMNNEHSR